MNDFTSSKWSTLSIGARQLYIFNRCVSHVHEGLVFVFFNRHFSLGRHSHANLRRGKILHHNLLGYVLGWLLILGLVDHCRIDLAHGMLCNELCAQGRHGSTHAAQRDTKRDYYQKKACCQMTKAKRAKLRSATVCLPGNKCNKGKKKHKYHTVYKQVK